MIGLLVSNGYGTPRQVGWEMSLAEVNTYLHVILMNKGLVCDWADPRANAATRTADRAAARMRRWQKH